MPTLAVRIAMLATGLVLLSLLGLALGRPGPPNMGWKGHVSELRRRVLIGVGALLTGAIAAFALRWDNAGQWGRPRLAGTDNIASQVFARMVADLKPDAVSLVVVRPIDGFLAHMLIALGIGAVVALPIIMAQIAGFVHPALKPRERQVVRLALVPMAMLFALGATFAYVYVLPFLLETLYGYGTALGAQPLLQVSEFVSFAVGLMLVLGLAFQTPLVMLGMSAAGLVSATTWLRGWRVAIVVILLLSALVTDPTVVSQLMVAAPLMLLYFVGVAVAYWAESSRRPSSRLRPS